MIPITPQAVQDNSSGFQEGEVRAAVQVCNVNLVSQLRQGWSKV
jgi:hypothetical protein